MKDGPWHADPALREAVGKKAEAEFDLLFVCAWCGVAFLPQPPPLPDRKCPGCGLEVDVKSAPDPDRHGAICISKRPSDRWSPGVVIAWRPSTGDWRGMRWDHAEIVGEPHAPTHDKRATPFVRVKTAGFAPILKMKPPVVRLATS